MGMSSIRLPEVSLLTLRRETDADGRCMDLLVPTRDSVEDLAVLTPGYYKIIFQTKDYFDAANRECFYPWVEVCTRLLCSAIQFPYYCCCLDNLQCHRDKSALSHPVVVKPVFLYNLPGQLITQQKNVTKSYVLYSAWISPQNNNQIILPLIEKPTKGCASRNWQNANDYKITGM